MEVCLGTPCLPGVGVCILGNMNNKAKAFTIVELLIVIVVIAILAAISIVAYTGIQNRAADTTVQSDLRSIAGKIMEYHALNGTHPTGGTAETFPGGISHSVSRNSYMQTGVNLYYCVAGSGSNTRFGLAARSVSGNIFAYYNGGFQTYSGTFGGSTSICPAVGIPTSEAGYEFHYGKSSAGTWFNWTQ